MKRLLLVSVMTICILGLASVSWAESTKKNDTKITIIKQVEQEDIYTINTITRDMIDLEANKKRLQEEIVEIDLKLTELEAIKAKVEVELEKIKGEKK